MDDWTHDRCTLPTAERPLRLAEFDELLAGSLQSVERLDRTRLRWLLAPDAEPVVRDLTARESECCSFFTFTVEPVDGAVRVDVEVPGTEVAVLDALAARAAMMGA